MILVKDMEEALELTNAYAPEHLIIETKDYMEVAGQIVNAGSVFWVPSLPKAQVIMLRELTILYLPTAMPKPIVE